MTLHQLLETILRNNLLVDDEITKLVHHEDEEAFGSLISVIMEKNTTIATASLKGSMLKILKPLTTSAMPCFLELDLLSSTEESLDMMFYKKLT
jgi:hypothetical protein